MKYLLLCLFCFNAYATDFAGLNYTVYAAGGAMPSRTTNGTVLATGVTNTLNYDWGGGAVLNSGRADGVLVHFTGSILFPGAVGSGTKTITFYNRSDDGFYMTVNGSVVISNWIEQGPSNFNSNGTITLSAGQVYEIDVWYYENGGGAVIQLDWNIGNGIVVVPYTNLATSPTFFIPPLCCGGSSIAFSASPVNTAKIVTFVNRTTADSKVSISQVGNSNIIEVVQSGTKNNYTKYTGSGSFNNIDIKQTAGSSTAVNYTDLTVNGNTNDISIKQRGDGGTKGAFVTVSDSNNIISLDQKNSGSHYADITLSGGNKNVNVLQEGSGSHMANITLSGQPINMDLTQSGPTQQSYSINFNCATAGGCAPIEVIQGQ